MGGESESVRQRCCRRPLRSCFITIGVLAGLAVLARYVVAPLMFWRLAENCERPAHTVVDTLQAEDSSGHILDIELRHYEQYLVAEVRLPEEFTPEQRRKEGFGQVAGYIFGKNRKRKGGLLGRYAPAIVGTEAAPEKIAMTAPVQQETASTPGSPDKDGAGKTVVVSFPMPSKYQHPRDLPVPMNPNVTIRIVPAQDVAAVGFRGPPPEAARVAEIQMAMERALDAAGKTLLQDGRGAKVYQYHDPFATPNMLRWNEVALTLAPGALSKSET
eukprot:TRINITY_DN41340_c0_g1_i1.p1 TRINITY_DN41340_c0_g1~~TRINITY_DN41340_c0_g1_i1.p1  ORF type:complete len:273 (-),score=61.47 TRINITY_DN41340_c0_g1_i1:472-1290(-)